MSCEKARDFIEPMKYIGREIPRTDATEKVSGRFRYLGDESSCDLLHAAVLMSPIPHGRVLKFDASRAENMEGVVRVFSPWSAPSTRYNSGVFYPTQEMHPDETILTDYVRHVGDRVAIVVATSERVARSALKQIDVTYEEYAPVLDPEQVLAEGLSIHPGEPTVFEGSMKYGDAEAAFASAHTICEDIVSTPRIHHAAMEPHVCTCYPFSPGGVEIHTPCMLAFAVHCGVGRILNLPLSKIRVLKAPMGGTFGGKQEFILEPVCAFLCLELRRPVRLAYNREETVIATRCRTPAIGRIRTAISERGEITARSIDMLVDAGAYLSGGKGVAMSMSKKVARLYRIPALSYYGRAVRTNSVPGGAARGYGSPQLHAITEIHTDLIAKRLKMDPIEFRRRNLVHPFEPDLSGGAPLGNAGALACLEEGVKRFRWYQRLEETTKSTGRYRRGIGMASATHINGHGGSQTVEFLNMSIRMYEDGSVVLQSALHEFGTGSLTVFAQLVAEVLSLPIERITATEADTLMGHYDVGCIATRVVYVMGSCTVELAQKLRSKLISLSARVVGLSPDDLYLENGSIRSRSDERFEMPYGEAVCRVGQELQLEMSETIDYRCKTNPGAYAAHFAEVEVDTLTGRVRVLDYLAVHDVGRALNPLFIRGQIYGGVQMGIGLAICEELKYDERGYPTTRNFDKLVMLNAPEMPNVDILLLERHEDSGPFGAKGVGEIATIPCAPAVVNAINRALNLEMKTLPLSPIRIVEALS